MKIQETSEDITKEEILFSSPKMSYMEASTQKDKEIRNFAPEAAPMRLGNEPCAQGIAKYAYAPSHAPGAC